MEWNLWTLTLLELQLHFFYGRTEGEGTLETQGFNSTQMKIIPSPMQVSEYSFSWYITRIPLPQAKVRDEDLPTSTGNNFISKIQFQQVLILVEQDIILIDSHSCVINRGKHPLFLLITGLKFSILIWQQ